MLGPNANDNPGQETTKPGSNATDSHTSQDGDIADKLYGGNEAPKNDSDEDKSGNDDSEDKDKGKDAEDKGNQGDKPIEYDLKRQKDSLLDDNQLADIVEYSKKQGLSNDQAKELLEREEKLLGDYKSTLEQEHDARVKQWEEEVKNDKEIGLDNFKKNVAQVDELLKKYSSDEFRKALSETGFGNHPELVRTFVKISEAMADDTFEPNGKGQHKAEKPIEDYFYGG